MLMNDGATKKILIASTLAFIGSLIFRSRRRTQGRNENSILKQLKHLSGFQFEEVLTDNNNGQFVVLKGILNGKPAVLKFNSLHATAEQLLSNLCSAKLDLHSESGAEYAYFHATIHNGVSKKQNPSYHLEIICPASDRQIRRSTTVPLILVDETSKDYANITLPYIQSVIGDGGSLQWVYNILDKKKEVERIVYDTGGTGPEDFIINIDTKWKTHPDPKETPREKWKDLVKPEDIYCLGIVQLRGLKSLRDLRGAAHLPLLRRLAGEGLRQVAALYSLPRGPGGGGGGGGGDGPASSSARLRRQLRVFVHYQPQFYHFHVHYVHAANDLGATCDRAHLLTDVIQNLELDPDFYTTRTITHRLQVTDQLHLLRSQQQEGEKNT